MNEEKFIEIMNNDELGGKDIGSVPDNAFEGLKILEKYLKNKLLICGADHDVIWSVGVNKIVAAGITEEDVIRLRSLNWMLEDDAYLACFV